ncbi:phage tail tape measure protein, partial [Kingella kingae]
VAGYNTGTVAALGATMRGFSIQEDIAATSIKNMMLALVAGETATKSQKAAWKKLGFDHEQIAKDMQKDAEGTTLKVLEAVSKLEKYKQASTLKELFGSESLLGIAPLLTSIDTVKKNLEGVKSAANFDGSMNKEYEARAAT